MAQQFEVFKSTVDASAGNRSRVNRHMTEPSEGLLIANLEEKVARLERGLQDSSKGEVAGS